MEDGETANKTGQVYVSRYYICTRFMIETLFHRTDLFYL